MKPREITSKYRLWLIEHGYAETQKELDRNKLEDNKKRFK